MKQRLNGVQYNSTRVDSSTTQQWTCLRVAQQEHLLLEDGVAVLLEEADGRVLDVVREMVNDERRVREARLCKTRVRVALDEVRIDLAAPVLVGALSELQAHARVHTAIDVLYCTVHGHRKSCSARSHEWCSVQCMCV